MTSASNFEMRESFRGASACCAIDLSDVDCHYSTERLFERGRRFQYALPMTRYMKHIADDFAEHFQRAGYATAAWSPKKKCRVAMPLAGLAI